ncbi:MAG: CDP-glucose 4,6-dehydratase [Parvicella sp.]|jgi:CDP-glucose 4,6-dehydratase
MESMVSFEQLKTIYAGKKVFLTGHTGFKGSWMLKTLHLLGAEVTGYSLAPQTGDDLFHLIKGDTLCHSIIADIRDAAHLKQSITDCQPDFIFHLAAQPLVRLSYDMPSETFEVNAIGTANLLEGVKELRKECSVILITTDKVYHNEEWLYPYRESDRLGGYDPYSASKACAELIIDSFRNSFFHPKDYHNHKKGIAVVRAGNVIGGGDWSKDRLIPDLARAFGNGKKLLVRNPKSVRPWQHVLEPVIGYLLLGQYVEQEPFQYSTAFNFGPESSDAISVNEMVKLSIEVWGDGTYESIANTGEPHEAGLLKLDISKVKNLLNWSPRFAAKEAVTFTLDWYKNFYDRTDMDDFTANQIKSFLNLK